MADYQSGSIDHIRIPRANGTDFDVYMIKDADSGKLFRILGVSYTAVTDGGSQKPTISGEEVTPEANDVVYYGSGEFVFVGTYGSGGAWHEFGDLSSLGNFAKADTATVSQWIGLTKKNLETTTIPEVEAGFVIGNRTAIYGYGAQNQPSAEVNNGVLTINPGILVGYEGVIQGDKPTGSTASITGMRLAAIKHNNGTEVTKTVATGGLVDPPSGQAGQVVTSPGTPTIVPNLNQ